MDESSTILPISRVWLKSRLTAGISDGMLFWVLLSVNPTTHKLHDLTLRVKLCDVIKEKQEANLMQTASREQPNFQEIVQNSDVYNHHNSYVNPSSGDKLFFVLLLVISFCSHKKMI